ncbi:MAG: hypothetical protein HOV79_34820 [Hamadaea sp.]|nr:hypothetical protein [Hamadaea sp.]
MGLARDGVQGRRAPREVADAFTAELTTAYARRTIAALSDECRGSAGTPPDPRRWGLRETDQWQPAGELQVYTRDPAHASHDGHGHLVVRALRRPDGV